MSGVADFISNTFGSIADNAPAVALGALAFAAPELAALSEFGAGGFTAAEAAGAGAADWAGGSIAANLGAGGLTSEGAGAFAESGLGAATSAGATALEGTVMAPWETMAGDGNSWAQVLPGLSSSSGGPGGSSGGGWTDTAKTAMQFAGPLMSIGSGIYGMSQADQMRKQAQLAANKADPWGASGGRAGADTQLQSFMADPSQTAANDPAYKLRIQAAQRATAGYGQNSGAMAVAGANASTDWYNARLAQLGGLAGANVNPGYGQQVAATYDVGANDLASKSLGSIGYGVTRAGGNQMPQAVRDWLLSQGMAA